MIRWQQHLFDELWLVTNCSRNHVHVWLEPFHPPVACMHGTVVTFDEMESFVHNVKLAVFYFFGAFVYNAKSAVLIRRFFVVVFFWGGCILLLVCSSFYGGSTPVFQQMYL